MKISVALNLKRYLRSYATISRPLSKILAFNGVDVFYVRRKS